MSNAIETMYSTDFVLWMVVFLFPFSFILMVVEALSVSPQWALIVGMVFAIVMNEICDRLSDRAVEGDNNE